MSLETILNAYRRTRTHTHTHTHTGTRTHEHSDYTKLNLHSLKRAANRHLRWMTTAARNRKHGRSTVLGKINVFRLHLNESREGFCRRGRGCVIPCRWTENRKGAGTNSGESGARNLEAESVRSRAESTEGCVKLKMVTVIRWSSACDTFMKANPTEYTHPTSKFTLAGCWAIQVGLLTPLTFARHRLSRLAAFISGAYFLHKGRR